jgi:hypothetical protein
LPSRHDATGAQSIMTDFEIAFTLVTLILGLSIVEVLSGLVRTLRRPLPRQGGGLAVLLGVAVICDLTTFWGMVASMRDMMPGFYRALSLGVLVTGVYYVAAGMVFPAADGDLDRHYFAYKRKVLGLVLLCNAPLFVYQLPQWSWETAGFNGGWLLLMLLAIAVRGVRANYVALTALILLYLWMFWA